MSNKDIKIFAVTMSNMLSLQMPPPSCSGKVHSKFNSGINVQFGEKLFYIGALGTPLSALGMLITTADLRQLIATVQVGEIVIGKDKRLVFYATQGIINLEYADVEYVDLGIPNIKCPQEQIANNKLYEYLSGLELEKKTGMTLDDREKKYIARLLESSKNDYRENLEIIRFFTGRGIGLTPSGDDLLLGFSFALCIFGLGACWLDCMRQITAEKLTTPISIAYAKALLSGYVSLSCLNLARVLDTQDTERIRTVVADVATFGHTSGYDTLYGFWLGLCFLIKDQK